VPVEPCLGIGSEAAVRAIAALLHQSSEFGVLLLIFIDLETAGPKWLPGGAPFPIRHPPGKRRISSECMDDRTSDRAVRVYFLLAHTFDSA
jgi:hypothetical protein